MRSLIATILFLFLAAGLLAQEGSMIHASFSSSGATNTASSGWPSSNAPNNKILSGYQQINYSNTTTAINTTSLTNAGIGSLAVNKENILYALRYEAANDYTLCAYNVANNYSLSHSQLHIDWDGSSNIDDDPQAMGIDANNKGWVVGYSVITGNNYISSFQSSASGNIDAINSAAGTLVCDLPRFKVNDIAFDILSNMYLLVQDRQAAEYYIYYLSAQDLAASKYIISRKWKLRNELSEDLKERTDYYSWTGAYFDMYNTYNCEGLAFDAAGNLVVAVDKMYVAYSNTGLKLTVENYFYKYSYPNNASVLQQNIVLYNYTQNKQSAPVSFVDDLASQYYQPFLPLSFKEVTATLNNNQLNVNWSTDAEKNSARFDIEVSTDGTIYKKLGTVNTNAPSGIATQVLNYSFSSSVSNISFAMLYGIMLLLLPLLFYKKSFWRGSLLLALIFFACKKEPISDTPQKITSLFVRVANVDSNGKIAYSKVLHLTN